jgi:hypothetical protein
MSFALVNEVWEELWVRADVECRYDEIDPCIRRGVDLRRV